MAGLTRRQALAGIIGAAAAGYAGSAAAAAPLTLVEPYGPHSSTDDAASLLRPALARILAAEVAVTQVAGDAGGKALARVAAAAPDDGTLLVAQLLSRFSEFPQADAPAAPSYRGMTPVARLTSGISAALVVPHGSPVADWQAFAARARAGEVRLAHNPIMLFALPLGMLEAHFGTRFGDVLASTRAEVVAALDGGSAEAGFLPTISLLTADGRPPLRPILTFGGERNPWFDGVPTFREVGSGVRTAITGAIAMFGPPGMAADRQSSLVAAVRAAGEDEQVRRAAAALRYPLQVDGPDLLQEAMDRCARVIRDMRPFLRSPA